MVQLRVQNHGMISPEAVPVLFEAFRRSASPSTPQARRTGLGLGLFIAREIARAHAGDIAVRSADDRTTFEVTLPRTARPVDTGALTGE